MSWTQQVFRYCERGADPAFWGEPLNAVTNLAFVAGGLIAMHALAQQETATRRTAEWLLALLVAVIGIGSFLFHTFATRWAAVADVAPIGVFMLAYLGYALRRYLALGWLWTGAGLAAFVGALRLAEGIECQRSGLIGIAEASRGPCLNGTLGYLPAWLAMAGIGTLAWRQRHPAARYLLTAAAVFLASMAFRTVDLELCTRTLLAGRALGTHFLWHLLNATTLTLLLMAAVRTGATASR